jgi:hypothetical protein
VGDKGAVDHGLALLWWEIVEKVGRVGLKEKGMVSTYRRVWSV